MQTGIVRKGRRWRARWIWDEGDGCQPNVYYYFRREFDLVTKLGRVDLHIAADTRYQLFVNGVFVGRGAPQSQPFYQYYDHYILDEYLQQGTNCVAVIVNHVGNLDDTRGGLLVEMVDADGATILKSDDTWRQLRAKPWRQDTHCFRMNKATPYQEWYDARLAPVGWIEIGYDDSGWARATVVRGRNSDRPPAVMPWSRLVPRDIPHMTATPVRPARIERIEETIELAAREHTDDLAPGLSQVGKPLHYTSVDGAETLCQPDGMAIVQGSLNHLDLDFDGIYTPSIVLDFGEVITARARLTLEGVAGSTVDIGYAERLIDGQFNIALEGAMADRYVLREGGQVFESFTWKAFRYLKLRFRQCHKPLKLLGVEGVSSTYPYVERGRFESSDEMLDRIWEMSRKTIRLCSNEFLMDTPWREQAQWLGDVALVTVPCIYAGFGDTKLPAKFLRQAGANQHPTGMISNVSNSVSHDWANAIPDYSLWWVQALWDHYLYTGDECWVHDLYGQALRVIQAHMAYVNERGLIEEMAYWAFVDWADVDKRGECAAYNAIYYGALEAMAKLAEAKGDTYTVNQCREGMARIKACFQDVFFDSERGCLADAVVDGAYSHKTSEQANLAAILWGLVDESIQGKIIDTLYESKTLRYTEAQPFFMGVVLPALARIGRFDLALDLTRQRWGGRMLAHGAITAFEEWYENGSWRSGEFRGFMRTHSHAWSAYPGAFLIHHLIGLRIIEPGCKTVSLAPHRTSFDYAVDCPTPLGEIRVIWKGGQLSIDAPEGMAVLTD